MNKCIYSLLLTCLILPALIALEVNAEFHLELADVCIVAESPGDCMKSYGYKCHKIQRPNTSLDAYMLGCNLPLADGQMHFVQMLNDGDEWVIEVQKVSTPEPFELPDPAEDSNAAITDYISGQMENYRISGSGGTALMHHSTGLDYATGHWRNGEQVIVRSVCAVLIGELLDDKLAVDAQTECEQLLLRGIQIRSQYDAKSPYAAAGANEINWETTTVTIASGDTALILTGQYTYSPEQTPCRWVPECCSKDGVLYLDSCRTPTEGEMEAAEACLADDNMFRSDEYFGCLKSKDVKVGCRNQADGSRLCY